MDWGTLGAIGAAFLGGGLLTGLVTTYVHRSEMKFKREQYEQTLRQERQQRLADVYRRTGLLLEGVRAPLLKQMHPGFSNLARVKPIYERTVEELTPVIVDWRANNEPVIADTLMAFRGYLASIEACGPEEVWAMYEGVQDILRKAYNNPSEFDAKNG